MGDKNLIYPISQTLRPFQITAINKMIAFMNSNESRGTYNAEEQGLGKTCQAIVAANTLECKNILIICPASVILNWVEELSRWRIYIYPWAHFLPILKSDDAKGIKHLVNEIVIVSYDMAKKDKISKEIIKRKWDLLILDESHKLKGRKTNRTKAVLGAIWPHCHYRIALSGTPITDSVVDAYPLFNAFAPSTFSNFYEFANRYAKIDRTPWGDKYFGIKNSEELKEFIRRTFFFRYTKEEVAPDLPEKTFTKIMLPEEYSLKVPKSDEEILRLEIERLRLAIEGGKVLPPIPTSIAGQRREQALKKLPPIIEFIEDLLEQQIPVVVFTYHTQILITLLSYFKAEKPSVLEGGTLVVERQAAVKKFQDGETNLFIGQIIAAGTGITLTRSSTVVFAELDWSPANVSQAIDRTHRIGQINPVNIYYFSIKGSIEESLINTIMRKAEVFSKLMD